MRSHSVRLAVVAILASIGSACGGDTAATTTSAPVDTTMSDTSTTSLGSTPTAESTTTTPSVDEVTITPPAEIGAGTEFTVAWTGPDNDSDYLTIVPLGADEGTYSSFFYTDAGPEGTLVAPPEAGEYEIRYVDGLSQSTIHSVPVTVSP